MSRAFVVAVVLSGSASWSDVPRPAPRCTTDAQCVMSSFESCCGSCCPMPKAWLSSELSRAQSRCRAVRCRQQPCVTDCGPMPVSEFEAKCVAGECVAQPKRADPDFCASDSDCVAVSSAGCCGSCCAAPQRVVSRARQTLDEQVCSRTRCEPLACSNIACAQMMPAPVRPVCRANRCVADRVGPVVVPVAECRVNTDCAVDFNAPTSSPCWSSPCGCCPSARAVPSAQVRPPPSRANREGPPFGLSNGGATACSACPPTNEAATAVCSNGRCVLGR